MIDFDLVLGPAMTAFARPITITPLKSQPGAPAYTNRGVWAIKPVEIQTEGGDFHSTAQPTIGIRLADFAVAPEQFDLLSVNGTNYVITDINPDGQGGADIALRRSA